MDFIINLYLRAIRNQKQNTVLITAVLIGMNKQPNQLRITLVPLAFRVKN